MVDSAKMVCGSVSVGRKNPKNLLWNDVVKLKKRLYGRRHWVLGMNKSIYRLRKKKRYRLKGVYIQRKKEVNGQFGKKMNQDENENRNVLWKEVSKVSGEKVKSFIRIKDRNGWLAPREEEVQKIWKDYILDLHNINFVEFIVIVQKPNQLSEGFFF